MSERSFQFRMNVRICLTASLLHQQASKHRVFTRERLPELNDGL